MIYDIKILRGRNQIGSGRLTFNSQDMQYAGIENFSDFADKLAFDIKRLINANCPEVRAHIEPWTKQHMITITCIYFKESGKYYSDGTGQFEPDLFIGCIYPKNYGDTLRGLRKLPGLQSGFWPYHFTVMVEGAYTELCLPAPATA